jgi:hypothetical protein
MAAALLFTSAALGQAQSDVERLNKWAEPLAEQLLALIPGPSHGLEQFAPWDYEFLEPPGWGCPAGCTAYTRIVVSRPFVVADPALAARVDATAERALAIAMTIAGNPSDSQLPAAQRALEAEEERLKKSVRRLSVELTINGGPVQPRGLEKPGAPAGTIAGYPVQRFAFRDASYEPTPIGIRLAVLVAPPGFTNPAVPDERSMKTEVKSVLVSVSLQTRPDTATADEAAARQLLERIDVAAVKKLLTP